MKIKLSFFKMIPFIIVTIIAIFLSLRGVNCAKGLGWATCSFGKGILLIFTLLWPIVITSFILFVIGLVEIIKNNNLK